MHATQQQSIFISIDWIRQLFTLAARNCQTVIKRAGFGANPQDRFRLNPHLQTDVGLRDTRFTPDEARRMMQCAHRHPDLNRDDFWSI